MVQAFGGVGMFRSQYFLPDVQGALVVGCGPGKVTSVVEEITQTMQAFGGVGMFGPQRFFPNGQGTLVAGSGPRKVTLAPEEIT